MKTLPQFIGHRGTMKQRTENTREAFDYTYRLKSAFEAVGSSLSFEFDIHLTRDGVPVLIHDENLWLVAGKHILVRDINFAELKSLSMNNPVMLYPGSVMTLEEMYEAYHDLPLHPEVKDTGERGREIVDGLLALIRRYDAAERTYVHFPSEEHVEYAQKTLPPGVKFVLPISLSQEFILDVYRGKSPKKYPGFHEITLQIMPPIDGKLVHCTQELFVNAARESGFESVSFWEYSNVVAVNETMLRQAADVGADGVITNDPLLALGVFADVYAGVGAG